MSKEEENLRELAKKYHLKYKGKISTELKVPVKKLEDFSLWYTPGVAGPCEDISEKGENVFNTLTNPIL